MNVKCLWRSQSPRCKAQRAKQPMWGDFVSKPRQCKRAEGTKEGRWHGTALSFSVNVAGAWKVRPSVYFPWLPTGPGGLASHAGWEQWLLLGACPHLEAIKPLSETFYVSPVNGAHVSRSFPGSELRGARWHEEQAFPCGGVLAAPTAGWAGPSVCSLPGPWLPGSPLASRLLPSVPFSYSALVFCDHWPEQPATFFFSFQSFISQFVFFLFIFNWRIIALQCWFDFYLKVYYNYY